MNRQLPVPALFFISVSDIEILDNFESDFTPFLDLTFLSEISKGIVLILGP